MGAPLFFRDDLAIHHMRLRRRRGSQSGYDYNTPMSAQMLTEKVVPNAQLVMNRLRTLCPQNTGVGDDLQAGMNSQCIRRWLIISHRHKMSRTWRTCLPRGKPGFDVDVC